MGRSVNGKLQVSKTCTVGSSPTRPAIMEEEDLVFRLRKRAEIRRQIATRKSVQEGKPDRLSDLLEEAANEIERLRNVYRRDVYHY